MAEKEIKNKIKQKKGAKKSFYEVDAPVTSADISLYASSPEELDSKTAKIDLSRNLRGKNLVLTIRIKNTDGKLTGSAEKIELAMSYIRKAMRRGTDYVEDSFETECRDGFAQVKPFLLTRNKVSRAVLRALRETARKNILAYAKTRTCEELIREIISNKLQKQILPKLKKIYPLGFCEIRIFEIKRQKTEKNSEEKTSS